MGKQKSIKKNMLMSIILTMSNFVFPLITFSYVARVLTPVGTGKVAFVNSIISYFSYIAILGIPAYGLRECAKVRDDKIKLSQTVQELLIINVVSTVISYILLFSSVLFVSKFFEYRALFAVISTGIFLNTIGVEWLYQALEEYTYITVRSLIFKCISMVLTFILIQNSNDYIWYGFLGIFTASASYVCNFINIKKYISFKKVDKYNFKRHLPPIFIFFSTSVIITLYANFDISMLGFISSENEVGLYNAALKIKSILLSLSTAVTAVLIPRMTYYFQQKNEEKAVSLAVKSLKVSMLLAIAVAVYTFIFSENVIRFVCGESYAFAGNTLRVLMLCIIPLILTNLFGNQILNPLGMEKQYSKSVFVGMWINLILNLALIPFFGAVGAAVGTLVTEIWNAFYMSSRVKKLRKQIFSEIKFSQYIIPLLVSVICSVITYHFVQSMHVFWQLVLTSIAFFAPYFVLLVLLKEDIITNQMKTLISKFKKN